MPKKGQPRAYYPTGQMGHNPISDLPQRSIWDMTQL